MQFQNQTQNSIKQIIRFPQNCKGNSMQIWPRWDEHCDSRSHTDERNRLDVVCELVFSSLFALSLLTLRCFLCLRRAALLWNTLVYFWSFVLFAAKHSSVVGLLGRKKTVAEWLCGVYGCMYI